MRPTPLLLSCLLLSTASTTAAAEPGSLEAGWVALEVGDLEAAQVAFDAAMGSRRTRSEARAGLLHMAVARADEVAMGRLLEGLRPTRVPEALLLAAGSAALALPTGDALPWAEAACDLPEPAWPEDTRELCSMAPLLRAAPERSRCVVGCGEGLVLPFSYAGSQPVVVATINGGEPVALLVDTGASSCLLTEAAAEALGLEQRPDTTLQIMATGGLIPSWKDLVAMELGSALVEDVEVVVADLPIAGLAGILSPQAAFPGQRLELDFAHHELRVSPTDDQPLAGVELPYRQHGGRPYLELTLSGRPTRPVVIDSGAARTHIDEAWEALAPSLERGETAHAEGAGGARSAIIPATGVLEASAGALPLPLTDPSLYTPQSTGAPGLKNHGLLGADAWMGRTLTLDPSSGRMALSDPPTLPGWRADEQASFVVTADGAELGRFTERVVARDDASVTLEVTIRGGQERTFTLRTPDAWSSRGAWMLTRPVLEAWEQGAEGERLDLADGGKGYWATLFRSFRTLPSDQPPVLVFGHHDVAGQSLSCTRLELPAVVGETPASFSMLECPASPWRTAELEVTADDDTVLWGMRRVE
jgi:hypothetical protein